jgi:hypothetical protein
MATLASLAAAMVLLAAPAAGEPVARVVLRWQAVAGAVGYELQIAPEPSFATPVVSERLELPGYRWADIPASRHYWRVRSVDGDGRTGPWSEVRPIEAALTAPEPVSPADGARIIWEDEPATVAFAFTRSNILRAYTVELSRDPDFGQIDARRTAPSPTIPIPLPGLGVFWWRTQGTALSGRETAPSHPRRLEVLVGQPRPLAPEPSEEVPFGPVALRWQSWTPVTRWKVSVERVREGGGGGEPAWQVEVGTAEAQFVPRRPGRYLWSVAAITPSGVAGPSSKPRELAVAALPPLPAPRPLAPGAGDVVGEGDPSAPVALSWESVPNATGYEVQVAAPGNLNAVPPHASPAARLTLSLPSGALAWRARAVDRAGEPGAWSKPGFFFHGRPPSARAEIVPGAGALVADGKDATSIAIRLFDAAGRRLAGAPVTVTATEGRIEGLIEGVDGWTARYVAPDRLPASGRSEIVVEDRGFTARVPVGLRASASRWRLGLLAGWQANLANASAPSLSLEVLWHAPWLSDRLVFAARAGTWATSVVIPAQAGLPAPLEATARVFPLSLLALLEWPVGRAAVYGGAGVGVHLDRLSVGPDASLEAAPSATLLLGTSGALGPGEVFAEVDASLGRVDAALGRLRTGGLLVGVGYRYRP